ncbi:MAG: cyclic nucleotide-binding domain-containing protein [Candidatus Poribacteria bacterium]|nr:cyclic nucleotide-binding domain-containing protein [Candidatus Poribacteria bacterium]
MNLFGLMPETDDSRLRSQVEIEISKWLLDTGFDADAKGLRRLSDLGLRGQSVLICLAQIKSIQKYKYSLQPESLYHILDLAQRQSILQQFIQQRPYLLAKIGIIYEHASTFLFGGNASQADLDACLLDFAANYISKFREYSSRPKGLPSDSPHRVLCATFWDTQLWHPAAYIEKAYQDNLLGVEYYVDFHPFNLNKLLPEDLSMAHRALIREWVERLKVHLSIHSAIVGPYSTPNYMGTQLFSDPADVADLQKETVLLARDIGASSLVLHLVDVDRLSELAEIIETAAGSDIRVTLENYYYTEKINQTSEQFIAVLESLIPLLTKHTREHNFGVTFDPGHYNIEEGDPIIAALHVGKWCKEKGIHLTKIHATTNYGPLRCFPPNFSSDVHDRVSHLGINNALIIQILRSIGHSPLVTAEQIKPLIEGDIALIDGAYQNLPERDYEAIVQKGVELLSGTCDSLVTPHIREVEAYQFIAGAAGVRALEEYLVYRKIQNTQQMTSETAKTTTLALMDAPAEAQRGAICHVDKILQSAIEAEGGVSQSTINPICERLGSALFAQIHREHLDAIFSENAEYQAGETICEEGAIGHEMFYITQGRVDIFITGHQISTLETGEIFGEISLFHGIPRSATVKAAAGGTKLRILKKESLIASLVGSRDLARAVIIRLYSILPERLRNLNAKYVHALKTLRSLNPSYSEPSVDEFIDEPCELDVSFKLIESKTLGVVFDQDRFYAPGEVVFHENTQAEGMYLIKSGSVRVTCYDLQLHGFQSLEHMAEEELEKIFDKDQFYVSDELASHESIHLARLGRGDLTGVMSLLHGSDCSATIVSDGATLGYLSKEAFDRIMKTDVNLSYSIMLTLCSTIISRIRQLDRAYLQVSSEIRRYNERAQQQFAD